MTFIDSNTDRQELQCIILNDGELYAQFDEVKFLDDGYSTEELCAAVIAWIESGNECVTL